MHPVSILGPSLLAHKQNIQFSCDQNQEGRQYPGNPQAALYLQETFAQPQVCQQQHVQVLIPSGYIPGFWSAVTAQGLEHVVIVCAGEMRGKELQVSSLSRVEMDSFNRSRGRNQVALNRNQHLL